MIARLLPPGVSHGPPVVSVCAGGCGNDVATYDGELPRGWSVVAGHRFCRLCKRRAAERMLKAKRVIR